MKHVVVGALSAALIFVSVSASAQQSGLTRTTLQHHDLSIPGREVVQVRVDFAPHAVAPPHTHPGEEIVYVLDGSIEYRVASEPPTTLHRGEVLFVPSGAIHSAANVGDVPASELATYIVEKGRPLVTPAS